MVLAILLLTSASLQMRAAGLPLKPIAYVAVFFAIVMVPLLVGNIALTIWPKPKAVVDTKAFAGSAAFEHPEIIFGADVSAAELRDAKPIFPEMVANAELAQLLIRGNGEMTLAARFASGTDAKDSSARFWTAFALQGTSGSEERGWWGTRKPAGDVVHLKRIGPGLALWIGPNKGMVRQRLADVRLSTAPPDSRPQWIRLFDRIPVQVASVLLLLALAAGWFFKGASWAGRIDGEGTPLSAAELSHRLSQVSDAESFRQIEDNVWELIVPYDTFGEVGRYRFLLRLDPNTHRVLVTEFLGRRLSPSASYNWYKTSGITFFRSGAGIDLQARKGPIIQAITSSGWDWQPVLWNVPAFLQ
jgi:uncharacterized protein YfiM (DUF2279 family)